MPTIQAETIQTATIHQPLITTIDPLETVNFDLGIIQNTNTNIGISTSLDKSVLVRNS